MLTNDGLKVLRLARARVHPSHRVFAVVRGNVCDGVDATLVSSAGKTVNTCRLRLPDTGVPCDTTRTGQRAVEMSFTCPQYEGERLMNNPGLSLRAGYVDTPLIAARPVDITLAGENPGESFRTALSATTNPSSAFPAELQSHGLAAINKIVAASSTGIAVELHEERIIVRSGQRPEDKESTNLTDHHALARGPFSWSGFSRRPTITCDGNQVTIEVSPAVLSPDESNRYEPTAMFAVMHTITWAANVLQSGSCHELRQPISLTPRFRAHPLLSATEIDEAVAALRRDREALGLVLLALAIASLALSLWRSVR